MWYLHEYVCCFTSFAPCIPACVVCSHQENAFNYDKGVLAEILEPIMGKGLIPADLDTWRVRRRAIVPAFHKAYYESMVDMFARCAQESCNKLEAAIQASADCRCLGLCLRLKLCRVGANGLGCMEQPSRRQQTAGAEH